MRMLCYYFPRSCRLLITRRGWRTLARGSRFEPSGPLLRSTRQSLCCVCVCILREKELMCSCSCCWSIVFSWLGGRDRHGGVYLITLSKICPWMWKVKERRKKKGRTLLSMMLIVWGPAELMEIYRKEEEKKNNETFYNFFFLLKKMRERFFFFKKNKREAAW